MCPGRCCKIKCLSLILVSVLLVARAAYANDMLLGHFKPLLFWGWRRVNWRDSFLHHRGNKCHSADLGGERAGKASEILPLLFLWFSRQNCKCGPCSRGIQGSEVWDLWVGVPWGCRSGDAGCLRNLSEGWREPGRSVESLAEAMCSCRDERPRLGGGTVLLTRGQLESLKHRRRRGKVIPSTREGLKTEEKDVAKFCRSAIGFQLLLQRCCSAVICLKRWEFLVLVCRIGQRVILVNVSIEVYICMNLLIISLYLAFLSLSNMLCHRIRGHNSG